MSEADKIQYGGDHYKNGKTQHWTFTWENDYNQFEYCVSKYVYRHKDKNGLEDLKKAQHHLQKYIELAGKLVFTGRSRLSVREWLSELKLDPSQENIIELVHQGYLDEAEECLTDYRNRYIHEKNSI